LLKYPSSYEISRHVLLASLPFIYPPKTQPQFNPIIFIHQDDSQRNAYTRWRQERTLAWRRKGGSPIDFFLLSLSRSICTFLLRFHSYIFETVKFASWQTARKFFFAKILFRVIIKCVIKQMCMSVISKTMWSARKLKTSEIF
jgi:hypothetical protein